MADIVQFAVNALSLGGTYALLAIGIALIYSVMGFLNIAHGDLITVCGYGMFFAIGFGLPWPLVIAIGIFAAGIGSVLMERVAFRPMRGANHDTLLLTSFAISAAIHVLLQIAIDARPKPVPLPAFLSGSFKIGDVVIGTGQSIAIVVTVLALIALTLFLKRTTLGLAMQAAAQDFDTTRLMGINANRVIATAFFIAGILAGIAGVLIIAQRGSVDPLMSLNPLIKALIAAIVGGTGSLYGPVLGGIILGLLETIFQTILPGEALLFRDPLVLSLLVAFLLFAPNGITGSRVEKAR
ncbi:branched-chain amino acid ABC transporter permease [Rhodobacteraceae bacterium nBUS_24]|jgi:branched-chain amino acid transport system permease protein